MPNQVKTKPQTNAKRESLRKILAGTTLAGAAAIVPDKWTAPVVNSVTLPAHAATTDTGGDGSEATGPFFTRISVAGPQSLQTETNQTPASTLMDILVQPAHANHLAGPIRVEICVTKLNETTADVEVRIQATAGQIGEMLQPSNTVSVDDGIKGLQGGEPTESHAYRGNVPIGGNANLPANSIPGACQFDLRPPSCSVSLSAISATADGLVRISFEERPVTGGAFSAPEAPCNFSRLVCSDID